MSELLQDRDNVHTPSHGRVGALTESKQNYGAMTNIRKVTVRFFRETKESDPARLTSGQER